MDTDTENTIKHKELKEKQAHRWLSDVVVQLSGSERCAHAPYDALTTKINRNVFKSTTFRKCQNVKKKQKQKPESNQRTGNRRSVLDCLIVSELLLYVCLVFFSLYFLFV